MADPRSKPKKPQTKRTAAPPPAASKIPAAPAQAPVRRMSGRGR